MSQGDMSQNDFFAVPPAGFQDIAPEGWQEAEALGITVCRVRLHNVTDKAGVMEALAEALGLHQDFGRNWDALYDVLTDPDLLPRALLLVLDGLANLPTELRDDLKGVLLDAQQDGVELGRRLWLVGH